MSRGEVRRPAWALGLALALLLSGCAPAGEGTPGEEASTPPETSVEAEAPSEPETSIEAEAPSEPGASGEPELSPEPQDPEGPAPEPEPGEFVRAADYIPNLSVSLPYAGTDNFTGQVIYDFQDAWLRWGTVQKLVRAAEELEEEGYGLLIWDAFRPTWAQFRLWEVCPDGNYVADPTRGFSSHSRGNTVDLTLTGPDGAPVEMPSGFDEFSALADRDYSDVSREAAANARLLEDVMTRQGFTGYRAEWWHYSDTDPYPVEEEFSPPGMGEKP